MAANPIEHRMWADIEALGGPDAIVERVAGGESYTSIAKSLGVSRNFFSWKFKELPGMADRLEQARKARAELWSEQALEIADDAPEEANAINKAKMRIDMRKWLATIHDPERFAAKPQTQVNISIGGLHLDALRRVQSAAKAIGTGSVIDGEARDVTDTE